MKHVKHWLATLVVLLCSVTASAETITDISQLSNTCLYHISTKRGAWAVAEGGDAMKSNADLGVEANPIDPRQQFAFISYNGGTIRYLYHVKEKKFVGRLGELCEMPLDPIYFAEGAYENTFVAYFASNYYVNINSNLSLVIDDWSIADDGNSFEIIPVGDIDPEEHMKFPMERDGLVYVKIGEGELMVKSAIQVSGDFTIPATITDRGKDYTVTSIGMGAFSGCTNLTSITIPETVTSIEDRAFFYCNNLTSINFPESIEWIGSGAFQETAWEANLAEGLHYIGKVLYRYVSTMPENTTIEVKEGTTSICSAAFSGCSNLAAITIPESVTSIGSNAFFGCSSLTAINIPEGVTSIGYQAFCGCSSLSFIVIPEGVMSIEHATFAECSSLTSITIPASVTYIGGSAFSGCSSLSSIIIPEGVMSIERYAFSGCSSLTTITIPDGVTTLPYDVFSGCSGLIAVNVGNGVTEIRERTFLDCSALKVVVIGKNVTSISDGAFRKIIPIAVNLSPGYRDYYWAEQTIHASEASFVGDYLFYDHVLFEYIGDDTNLVLPNYKEQNYEIASNTFYDRYFITSVDIPEGVTCIGDSTFYGCGSLASITIPESVAWVGGGALDGTAWYEEQPNGVAYAGNVLYKYKGEMPENTSIDVRKGTLGIGEDAFSNCSGLVTVNIPESTTAIGSWAFAGCCNLGSITIPDSVTRIEDCVFSGCSSLVSVVVPENVESVGGHAFEGCSSLISITNLEKVREIGDYAFYDCSSLTSIDTGYASSLGDSTFVGCNSLERVVLNCSTIGTCFNGLPMIKEVVLGKYVRGTEMYPAFSGCTNLERVTFNCTNVGNWFRNNTAIKKVILGEGVTAVENDAFANCSGLTSITIGKNVTVIGDGEINSSCRVFDNCTSLKQVVFEDGNKDLFVGCNVYSSSSRPSSREKPEGLFYDCPLEKVYLGRNLSYYTDRRTGYSPFYNKGTLTSLAIGPEVTRIGDYAFSDCALDSITCYAEVPPTCYANTFDGVNTSIPVYVPEASVADYQSAEVWKDFLGFVGVDTEIEQTTDSGCQTTVIYDLMGRRITNAEGLKGIYIINGRKVVIK